MNEPDSIFQESSLICIKIFYISYVSQWLFLDCSHNVKIYTKNKKNWAKLFICDTWNSYVEFQGF